MGNLASMGNWASTPTRGKLSPLRRVVPTCALPAQVVKLARMSSQDAVKPRIPVFSLGERIRKVREDMELSQFQFADLLDVDRKTVGNWEAGRNQPRYGDLMLIASVSDTSLEWLAGDLYRPQRDVGVIRRVRSPLNGEWMRSTRPGRCPVPAGFPTNRFRFRFTENQLADIAEAATP